MKNSVATNTGAPKPPFLMIDPRGAPIKKNSIHATAKLIFLCHSILCFVIIILWYSKSSLFDFVIDSRALVLFIAILYCCFVLVVDAGVTETLSSLNGFLYLFPNVIL